MQKNWGLVTYREVDLLIDPITASSKQKQRVLTVVTHELAHQWFGNLVTYVPVHPSQGRANASFQQNELVG
jgi:aminopeptidase N